MIQYENKYRPASVLKLIVLMVLFIGVSTSLAFAQHMDQAQALLATLNDRAPLQNSELTQTRDLVGRKVVDNKNKVIGKVDDILISRHGSVSHYLVDFNRLNLNTPVYLTQGTIQTNDFKDRFRVDFDDNEVEAMYPNLLSQISPASGKNSAANINVKNLKAAKLYAEDGRFLGTVDQVLFNQYGTAAKALYVDLKYRGVSGVSLAIPFQGLSFVKKGRSAAKISVSDRVADTILAFAAEK